MLRYSISNISHQCLRSSTAFASAPYNQFRAHLSNVFSCIPPRGQHLQMSTALNNNGLGSRLSSSSVLTRQQQPRIAAFHVLKCQHQQQIRPMHGLPVHSRQQSSRWQVKAEVAGSGGGSSGSGGKKGYSSGDGSAGDGGLWGAYNRALESNPLLVKAITTAVLSAVGNLICQLLIEKKEQLDMRRLNIFTVLGLVWVAPCLHFWFGTLNRLVTMPGNAGALLRMACDQLGFAPIFISSMIAILSALDGKADKVVDIVKADLPSAITANWILWVPAQFINFRFVPATYQVLFANVVALAWNVYFSFATRPKEATA